MDAKRTAGYELGTDKEALVALLRSAEREQDWGRVRTAVAALSGDEDARIAALAERMSDWDLRLKVACHAVDKELDRAVAFVTEELGEDAGADEVTDFISAGMCWATPYDWVFLALNQGSRNEPIESEEFDLVWELIGAEVNRRLDTTHAVRVWVEGLAERAGEQEAEKTRATLMASPCVSKHHPLVIRNYAGERVLYCEHCVCSLDPVRVP